MAVDDAFLRALRQWERADDHESAARRRQHRDTATQLAWGEATFTGLLIDAFEARQPVRLDLVGGRTVAGSIRTVGADCLIVESNSGTVVVRTSTLIGASVDGPPPGRVPSDRVPATSLTLDGFLQEAVALRPAIRLFRGDDTALTGTLDAVGNDVILVSATTDLQVASYVPIAAITELRTV